MTRRSLAGLALAATLLVVPVAGCTQDDDDPDPPDARPSEPTAALTPDCPPPPKQHPPITASSLNKLVASIDLEGWQAGDIGASGQLRDGRLVWLFGDTTRTELQPPLVANSMLVTSGPCVSQLRPADDGPVVPDLPDGVVHWPMSVVVGRQGGLDTIVVLCSRIDRGDSGAFGFTFLGTTAAVFTVAAHEDPQLVKVVDITPDSRDPQQVNWGAAATAHGGWYFVYGTRLTGKELEFGRELYVARVPADDPGTRRSWRFWDGAGWQADVDQAQVVLPADGGVSQTLSVDVVDGEFVAVSKRDGDLSDFVYKWTAREPWGPWSPVQELQAPGGFDTGSLEYAPLAHPEVPLASGRLLVSVSRNTTDLAQLLKDPQLGRPVFVELPR
jgi:hypothetical protein